MDSRPNISFNEQPETSECQFVQLFVCLRGITAGRFVPYVRLVLKTFEPIKMLKIRD